jgi:hypothetical protein
METNIVSHRQALDLKQRNNFHRPGRRIACLQQMGDQSKTSHEQTTVMAAVDTNLLQKPSLLNNIRNSFHLDAFRFVNVFQSV